MLSTLVLRTTAAASGSGRRVFPAAFAAFSYTAVRPFSSKPFHPIPVDLEHYTEGWNVKDVEEFTQSGHYAIQTFNKISQIGLAKFPSNLYTVEPADASSNPAHALMLRSHKLQEDEIDVSVRAIARCGAGTNNIPVQRCTELGIPVFNTPGANANAVKELILCGMLLASRRIVDGINHMKELGREGKAKERVEKDKAMFKGRELKGKTLAVIGLGHIGAATARDARVLGMNVQVRCGLSVGLLYTVLRLFGRFLGCSQYVLQREANRCSDNLPLCNRATTLVSVFRTLCRCPATLLWRILLRLRLQMPIILASTFLTSKEPRKRGARTELLAPMSLRILNRILFFSTLLVASLLIQLP